MWWPDSADLNLGTCDHPKNLQTSGHKPRLSKVDGLFNIVMKANTRLHAYLSTLPLQPLCKGIEGQACFMILIVKEVIIIFFSLSLNIPIEFLFYFSPLLIYKSFFYVNASIILFLTWVAAAYKFYRGKSLFMFVSPEK